MREDALRVLYKTSSGRRIFSSDAAKLVSESLAREVSPGHYALTKAGHDAAAKLFTYKTVGECSPGEVVLYRDICDDDEVRETHLQIIGGPGKFYPETNVTTMRLRCVQGVPGEKLRYDSGMLGQECHLSETPSKYPVLPVSQSVHFTQEGIPADIASGEEELAGVIEREFSAGGEGVFLRAARAAIEFVGK